jgi:hypothetical protein
MFGFMDLAIVYGDMQRIRSRSSIYKFVEFQQCLGS